MSQLQGSHIWYELMTSDAEAARAFYEPVVGWTFGEAAPEFQGYRMINCADGGFAGGVLPISDEMASKGTKPRWLGYVGVDDVDATVASVAEAGGTTWMPATDLPGIGRVALLSDFAGAPFYVMTPTPRDGQASDVFALDRPGRCGWNELQTTDVEKARGFYGERFGWGSDRFMDMGPLGEYRFWERDGGQIGALFNPQNGKPGSWRYYFRVPSISVAKAAAEANGGKIAMGPHQVPTGDWVIVGTDPQGAEFALVGGE